jgi:di/tricarboxylate transporter
MGFAAILGGTLTMVASGPLIVLNDLIGSGDYERFGLFEVTPVGVALLGSGILYFYFFGGKVLPNPSLKESQNHQDFLKEIYELPDNIYEVIIKEESTILDQTIESLDIWEKYNLHILALYESGSIVYAPWRKTRFHKEQILAILGKEEQIKAFVDQYDLEVRKNLAVFANIKNEQYAGFAEIIVPPKSELKGKTLWEIAVRKNFSIEPISYINQAGERINCFKEPLEPGQELLVFGRWEDITKLKDSRDLVVVTEISHVTATEGAKKNKQALFSLTVAIILVLLGVRLSLGFFTGALLMILLGVIPKDEIYQAVDWKTVFLLAGLIPLGGAFEQSGAANLTADIIMGVIHSWGVLPILFVIGLLATFFSLFMSNVAAAVLLVPLVLIMGENFGIDPRGMALLVAVCTSNSFVLPTHQVNAFIMTPGGYKNVDYMKAGGMMTIVFLVVAVFMIYLFYI